MRVNAPETPRLADVQGFYDYPAALDDPLARPAADTPAPESGAGVGAAVPAAGLPENLSRPAPQETEADMLTRLQRAARYGLPDPLKKFGPFIAPALERTLPTRPQRGESWERNPDGSPVRVLMREDDPNFTIYHLLNDALVHLSHGRDVQDYVHQLSVICDELLPVLRAKQEYDRALAAWRKAAPVHVFPPAKSAGRR